MIYNASGGHTGGSLSAADILVVLYHSVMNISPATGIMGQGPLYSEQRALGRKLLYRSGFKGILR
jgi:transketolase N-terminal domain/subunit